MFELVDYGLPSHAEAQLFTQQGIPDSVTLSYLEGSRKILHALRVEKHSHIAFNAEWDELLVGSKAPRQGVTKVEVPVCIGDKHNALDFMTVLRALSFPQITLNYEVVSKKSIDDGIVAPSSVDIAVTAASRLQYTTKRNTFQFLSSTDGYCFINALMLMSYHDHQEDGENPTTDCLVQFSSVKVGKEGGASVEFIRKVCQTLELPVFTIADFFERFNSLELKALCGDSSTGYQLTPCLILDIEGDRGHCYIAHNGR